MTAGFDSGALQTTSRVGTSTIEARGLVRTFEEGRVVALDDVDFDAKAGEMVAVTGPSGSGKTTLLNVLGLLDRPDAGVLHLNGVDVSLAAEKTIRRMRAQLLGFVFQDSLLDMNRTAMENVMLGLRYAGIERGARSRLARESLEWTGTDHRSDARGSTLSGGERQRVAIARAVAHRPSALLCDEPTGALDEGNTERVLELLRSLASQSTAVVIVTHDLDIARRCDRWTALRDGSIAWPQPVGPES